MRESRHEKMPFRRLLMLQGPAGPFFQLLARDLGTRGVSVRKVNLNAGDALYFPGPNAMAFSGRSDEWPDYLAGLLKHYRIDALALFGETRFYHREAIDVARAADIPVFVFEEGYIRPDYVTIELGGVNGRSSLLAQRNGPGASLSRDPESRAEPARFVPVGNSFPAMVGHCMAYWAAADLGRVLFPHYRHHKPGALAEVKPWLLSAYRKLRHARHDRVMAARLLSERRRYFLVPLQVHRDSQIVRDSPFLSVGHFIIEAMKSFAAHAPVDHVLLIKQHPLDRGHTDYTALIADTAARLGCVDRVVYIRDAHLPTLLQRARGTVTINSTVGLSSLFHGTPVKALGHAVYDRPGLTAQCSLQAFWTADEHVDAEKVQAFTADLIDTCQVNGSFYTRWPQTGLVRQIARRMAALYTARYPRAATRPIMVRRAGARTPGDTAAGLAAGGGGRSPVAAGTQELE